MTQPEESVSVFFKTCLPMKCQVQFTAVLPRKFGTIETLMLLRICAEKKGKYVTLSLIHRVCNYYYSMLV